MNASIFGGFGNNICICKKDISWSQIGEDFDIIMELEGGKVLNGKCWIHHPTASTLYTGLNFWEYHTTEAYMYLGAKSEKSK